MDHARAARIIIVVVLCASWRIFTVGLVFLWFRFLYDIILEYAHGSVGIFGAVSLDSVHETIFGRKEGYGMKNTIHVERAIRRITQADLAAAVGVSRQTINALEAAKYVPSVLLAMKIANYFEKPVEAIFELGEED